MKTFKEIKLAGLSLLTLLYALVLLHALKGSKYRFVYFVGGLGLSQALLSILANSVKPYFWIAANPAFFSLYWILASKYNSIAFKESVSLDELLDSAPLESVQSAVDETSTCQKIAKVFLNKSVDRTMLILNLLLAAANGFFYTLVTKNDTTKEVWIYRTYGFFTFAGSLLLLLSGLMLLNAVIQITRKLKNKEHELNLK
jgi:hypothetical protein